MTCLGYLARLFQSSYQKYRTASVFRVKLAFGEIQKVFIKKPHHTPFTMLTLEALFGCIIFNIE